MSWEFFEISGLAERRSAYVLHFKHILSEREEHFHEKHRRGNSRRAAAQKQYYDITLHRLNPSRVHVLLVPSLPQLFCARVLKAIYKEPKELVVGAEPDFCPHAYTTNASPRRT